MVVFEYLLMVLAGAVMLFLIFCVLWFLVAMIRIWILMRETRGMSRKELKKAEQELCKHLNTVYTDKHPDYPWTCCDCGKNV